MLLSAPAATWAEEHHLHHPQWEGEGSSDLYYNNPSPPPSPPPQVKCFPSERADTGRQPGWCAVCLPGAKPGQPGHCTPERNKMKVRPALSSSSSSTSSSSPGRGRGWLRWLARRCFLQRGLGLLWQKVPRLYGKSEGSNFTRGVEIMSARRYFMSSPGRASYLHWQAVPEEN